MMRKEIALKLVGGLSDVSKMPGLSFGLPTSTCKTGAKLAKLEGSICGDCYAKKGHYRFCANTVLPAQHRRLAAIDSPEWIDAMVASLRGEYWFRWFDSGDLQSSEMLLNIFEVCRQTPNTRHWLATRERRFVREALTKSDIPVNLVVRVSATYPDIPVKPIEGVNCANVHDKKEPVGFMCPAPKTGGRCDTCRACWDKAVGTVSYAKH